MSITTETRWAAYSDVIPQMKPRQQIILEYLIKYGDMNADELAYRMYRDRVIPRPSRTFVAPRLTELKKAGILENKEKSKSNVSGKMIAVWSVIKCPAE